MTLNVGPPPPPTSTSPVLKAVVVRQKLLDIYKDTEIFSDVSLIMTEINTNIWEIYPISIIRVDIDDGNRTSLRNAEFYPSHNAPDRLKKSVKDIHRALHIIFPLETSHLLTSVSNSWYQS
jgi:hypothetical protein